MRELNNYKKNITSQWGEDGIIEEIFNRVGLENPLCVEFEAWDGEKYSNTWNLWNNKNWSAVLIERNKERFQELIENTSRFKKVIAQNKNIEIEGKNSLDNILLKTIGEQTIDLLSIDVDGDDYHIFQSLKEYCPRVVIIEHNPTIPENIKVIQKKGGHLGSSALATCKLAEGKGYSLVTTTETNCIFIRNKEFLKLSIKPQLLKDIFIDNHITYLMTSYEGTPFLNKIPPYFNSKTKQNKLSLPNIANPHNFIPIFMSLEDDEPTYYLFFQRSKLIIKHLMKKILPKNLIVFIKNSLSILKWILKGKSLPPPHIVKQKTIKKYAKKYNIKILIETGTYKGKMITATKDIFKKIYSIELDKTLYEEAKIKFKNVKHVKIIQGDSGEKLFDILKDINTSCLFWLDGHYSGDITAKGKLNTPIFKELEIILNHKIKNHVILIDDARCFTGRNDYPRIEELKSFIKNKNNKLKFNIKNDIIRIC